MNPPTLDSNILKYARDRGIAVSSEMNIASELSISEILPPHYKDSDEIAIGFKKFYSTARKDLEPRKLDLNRASALLLIAQQHTSTESHISWENMLPSMNQVGTRSGDPPLQSEQTFSELQSIISRNGAGFNPMYLKPEHAQNGPQSVGLDSYFAPHIAQRLGFGTVWGQPKNYDTPPRLSESLAQAQDFGSLKLDVSKKSRTLMSKDWGRDGESSSKVVESMRYEMPPQHKTATLFHDTALVPERVEVQTDQSLHFTFPARTRKIAAMRQGKPQSKPTALPNFQFPERPARTEPREDKQALPSIPEDTQAESQSEQIQTSPYFQSGSPAKGPDSAASSMFHKDALDADPPANGTASRPISVEASPELHTNESSLEDSGGVPESPRSADSGIASSTSDKLIPVISNPLPTAGMVSATERVEVGNGKSFQRTGLTGTPPIGNSPKAVLKASRISSIGPFSTGLGSLSTFMETRGVVTANGSATSAYFPRHETTKINEQQHQENQGVPSATEEATFRSSTDASPLATLAIIKSQLATKTSDLLLFLSIDILKTHLQVVQCLEQQPIPPRLIYREYNQFSTPGDPGNPQYQQTSPEADFIIAPAVGIILASFHALTQIYLPGHRPEDPYIRNNPNITSPLKERIFRLAPRYEILYLLIGHPVPKIEAQGNNSMTEQFSMSNSTQESLKSLALFCDSLSHSTTITPVHIPTLPEQTAEWIITLAAIHTYHLPKISIPAPTPGSNTYAFGISRHVTLNQILRDDETKWEIFLRAIGLNPFAARTVLDILDAEGHATTESEASGAEYEDFPAKNPEEKQSALATFIEMKPKERLDRFQGLIGEGLWARLHDVIEVD
ncbi:hypothetical protein N7486_007153 [Penicillium sp. IBT 16267x]|nr:hypothetical protein N7486_007153 [Penicillium sp. IBT 16267x]